MSLGAVAVALALVTATSCGRSSGGTASPATHTDPTATTLDVVVTTPILGELVRAVAGDRATVTELTDRTDEPRTSTWPEGEPSPLTSADLVVAIDPATYEVGLAGAIDEARHQADGPSVVIATEVLDARRVDGTPDARVWLDPDRYTTLAREVASALAERSGTDPAPWQAAAEDYGHQLALADEEVQATLAPLPPERHRLAVSDQRLGYFADRYGLELVTVPSGAGTGTPVLDVEVDRLGPEGSATGTLAGLLTSIAAQVAAS